MLSNSVRLLATTAGLLTVWALSPASLRSQTSPQEEIPPGISAELETPAAGSLNGDYRVGAGDVIQVAVWREPEASLQVSIRPDGKISLPLINDLLVVGMTPMEIQQLITKKLESFITSPNVTVIVRQILSKKVYVIGEVNRTGAFQMTQPFTIFQLLTEAGGLRPFADQKSIYVLRVTNGKQERFLFNYKEVVRGRNLRQDILLQPGDMVVVP